MELLKQTLFLVLLSVFCECANILYVVPFSSKSHNLLLKPLGLELARRGHNVTVITSHKEKKYPSTYREIMVDDKELWEVLGAERPNLFDMVSISAENFLEFILWGGGLGYTEMTLNSTEIKKFLAEDNSFDIVIVEQFYQEALNILAHKFQAPLVLITAYGNCMRHNIVTRNPLQFATVVHEYLDLRDPTTFISRLRNFYFSMYDYVWWRYWYLDKHEQLVKKYIKNLPEPVPRLYEMQQNASLILVNGHFSFDAPTAYLPNIVEIGGIHLTKTDTKLPDDLQKLIDGSPQGVVYVNFGSNVRSAEMPVEKRDAFLNVFRKLKQTVIWKWEDDKLVNKPDNLVIRKWLPQKEILSHPNVKVFLSHGGLIGTQEAIFLGVPIIGIPIYGDQYNNLLQAQEHGFGKILQFNDINEKTLYSLLSEMLSNDSYKKNAKEISERFKDRPMSPMDTAIYWIEHVIKHKGANYMKNPSIQLSWIAYTMLDVYAFVLAILLIAVYSVYKILTVIRSRSASSKLYKRKLE